jgi:hypothetical protein
MLYWQSDWEVGRVHSCSTEGIRGKILHYLILLYFTLDNCIVTIYVQYKAALQRVGDNEMSQEMDTHTHQEENAPDASPPPSAFPETLAAPHLFQVKQRLRHAIKVANVRISWQRCWKIKMRF